ncbi:MAG TPA: argininosuccinate lyase [Candidatus Binataceae bacterium]
MKPRPESSSNRAKSPTANLLRARFGSRRLPEVEAFTASLPFDRRLYRHDIMGSIAHARMLAKVRLISSADARRIVSGLTRIEREIDAGRFRFENSDEDIHLAIERRLTALLGPPGAKLHTARSRNDQIALDLRLYLRDEIGSVLLILRGFRASLLRVAENNVESVMPGYTHLQRAQPVSLAHHLLAYVEMLDRDRERFAQALDRTAVMPLGAGALAATTLPIDRSFVARALGFERVTQNSIDSVSDRDFAVDFLSAAALCAVHLSRMAEEIIFWSSSEFAFVTIPDQFSTGSSMMPQKKNPDLLELIRAKSARVIGDLVAMLTTLKGLPLAYNSDLQEDKELVFDALDTLKPSLEMLSKLWPKLIFDHSAMRSAAGGFALATDLAEYLVRRGIPFRKAHEITGALVRDSIACGKSIEALTLAELRRYSPVFGPSALAALNPADSLTQRKVLGGPAPATVRRRIKELKRL